MKRWWIFFLIIGASLILPQCGILGPDEEIFIIETIAGTPIDPDAVPVGFDRPLKIKITRWGGGDADYAGEVKMARLGWTPIDRDCATQDNCFILDTIGRYEEEYDEIEGILFSFILNSKGDEMEGYFIPVGALADYRPINFTATRQ